MGFAISLTIESNKVEGILAVDDLVCWKQSCGFRKNFFPAINNVLINLLKAGAVSPAHIKCVLVTVDFLDLYAAGKLPCHRISYIRYLPKMTQIFPPLAQSPFKKLVVAQMVISEQGISDVLKKFTELNLPVLAINPSFSYWTKTSVARLEKLTKDILGADVLFSAGTIFNRLGYITRENLLLINALLLPGVNFFFVKLRQQLVKLNINAKILVLQNNGMLFSENTARKLPIYTAGVHFAAQLIATAKFGSDGNVVVVTQKADNVCLGMTENCLPVLSSAPFYYHQVQLSLLHPITRSIPITKDSSESSFQKAVIESLSTMNPAEECLPVTLINLDTDIKNILYATCQKLFMPVTELNIHLGMGALLAPTCIEEGHYVPYYTGRNKNKKKDLQAALKSKAEKEGFNPNNEWQFYFEEKPIRYLPEKGSLLRLMYYGPRNI